jgi:hypothetical protein
MEISVFSGVIGKKKDEYLSTQLLLCLGIILLYLLFNPFIALFIIAVFASYLSVPKLPFLLFSSVAFTLFFFYREYDVAWASSTDDVPTYVLMYLSNKGLSFFEIFTRFFTSPGNNEPLWHMPFWMLLNVFDASQNTFIFIHYLIIFTLLFYTMISISSRYYSILILAYFFLTPVAIDSMFHIWRQQLASTIFLLGCNIYLVKGKTRGKYLIYLSVLVHLVCMYFLVIFLFFNFLRKRGMIENKTKFFFYALALCMIFILVFDVALKILASFNLDKVLMYAEGSGASSIRLFIVMSIFMGSLLVTHIIYKNDNLNKLIIFVTFVVTTMTLAFPIADSIFSRLAYFTVPLVGLYFARLFIINLPQKWLLAFVLFIFTTGLYRIISIITDKFASAQFLAFSHPLDPFMGIIKMLLLYY